MNEEVVAKLRAARESFAWVLDHLVSHSYHRGDLEHTANIIDITADADSDLLNACTALAIEPPDLMLMPGLGDHSTRKWLEHRVHFVDGLLASLEQQARSDGGPYR